MEVVAYYTRSYHRDMALLNAPPPSIEPTATGHIIEQIQMIEKILANGYAYEVDGNVYFDVVKYNKDHAYGKLSGRNIRRHDVSNTREFRWAIRKKKRCRFCPSGKRRLQSILCGGLHHGLKVFRAGI